MKNYLMSLMVVALCVLAVAPSATRAETTGSTTTPVVTTATPDMASLMATLKMLMERVAELQKQLQGVRTEIAETLGTNLAEGTTNDDIKAIQEILATDSTIYPERITTGYYGPLTREAIKRFQEKNGLEVTGTVNAETRAAFETIMAERKANGGQIPYGFLRAPGLKDKFEDRFAQFCEKAKFERPGACERVTDRDDDENRDDVMSSSTRPLEIKAEIDGRVTEVTVKYANKREVKFVVNSNVRETVIRAVAARTVLSIDTVRATIKFEESDEAEDEDEDDDEVMEVKEKAEKMMSEAEEEIEELEGDLDGMTGSVASRARELLTKANGKLAAAETSFRAGRYREAEEYAELAEDAAKDGQSILSDDDDEDEDEDEDDEDDEEGEDD